MSLLRAAATFRRSSRVGGGLPDGHRLEIVPMDAALVGPAGADFMTFSTRPPDFAGGLRFNLYNNKWGTNFPMWWEGDVQFRFLLRIS